MTQEYSDVERENDPCALPDIEVFQLTAEEVAESGAYHDEQHEFMQRREFRLACMNSRDRAKLLDAMASELGIRGGWFWQSCFPGCLPDSEPIGPFDSYDAALADARDGLEEARP
jgi:hypothetical protein